MDTQGDAPETLPTEDLYQDLESEVGVSDEDGGERVAPESDEEIVDETLYQSPMKNSTRSKSWKVVVPEPLIPSDSEDDVCRPQQCKRNHASPASQWSEHFKHVLCHFNKSLSARFKVVRPNH
jgi:hypothetical protein